MEAKHSRSVLLSDTEGRAYLVDWRKPNDIGVAGIDQVGKRVADNESSESLSLILLGL